MGAKAERKDELPASPSAINWCGLTEPSPCPNRSYGRCWIKRRLGAFPTKRKDEAERLYKIAKEDPKRLFEICERSSVEPI